jgi:radical SAM protein with 4Fe4S-binding SPASM domain
MNKNGSIAIKLLQKNKLLARAAEDMYSRIPYFFMNGRAMPPLSAVLLLTYRCNLRCRMCFYYNEAEKDNTNSLIKRRAHEELSLQQIKKLIDDLAKSGVKVLTLHGGEPLVHPEIYEISKYAASMGLMVNFITNGVLLNEKNIDSIIDAKINGLTISIDGPEKIHDEVRGMEGTFKKIEQGLNIIREKEKAGKKVPQIGVSTYISAINQDGVLHLFDELLRLGIDNWGVGLVTYNSEKLSAATKKILGIEDGAGQGNLDSLPGEITGLDTEKMLAIRQKLKKLNSKHEIQVLFPSEKAIKKYSDPFFNEMDYCLYPWARVVISPYGEVFPCVSLSMINADMGNIKNESIMAIWNGKKFTEFRKKLKKHGLFPICSKCCVINNVKSL